MFGVVPPSAAPAGARPASAAPGDEPPARPPGPPPALVPEEALAGRSAEPKGGGDRRRPESLHESEDTDGVLQGRPSQLGVLPELGAGGGGARAELPGQAFGERESEGSLAVPQAARPSRPTSPSARAHQAGVRAAYMQTLAVEEGGAERRGSLVVDRLSTFTASAGRDSQDGPSPRSTSKQSEQLQRAFSKKSVRSFLAPDPKDALFRAADSGIMMPRVGRSSSESTDQADHRWANRRLMIWLFLEEPFEGVASTVFSTLMVLTIFASVLYSVFSATYNAGGEFEADSSSANHVFNIIFVADVLIRFIVFPAHRSFLWQARNVVDVVCVLPFILNDVLAHALGAATGEDPRGFKLLWLTPYEAFFRLNKLSRYFWGWNLLYHAMSQSVKALVIPLFFISLVSLFGSCTLYIVESLKHNGDPSSAHDFGEEHFVPITTLPDAIHFVVIVILSVSSGPFYGLQAASHAGQMIVVLLMVTGVIFMAMPIAITGSCFSQTWFDQDRIMLLDQVRSRLQAQGFSQEDLQTVFEEVDQDKSGAIEFEEFRQMIETFNLRSLNAAKIRKLFQCFDNDGDGEINFTDFCLTLYPEISVFSPGPPLSPTWSSEREDGGGGDLAPHTSGASALSGRTFVKAQTEPPRSWMPSRMKAAWNSRLSDPPRNHKTASLPGKRRSQQDLRKRVHAIQRRDAESVGERQSNLSCPSSSSSVPGSPLPTVEGANSDEEMAKRVSSGATVERLVTGVSSLGSETFRPRSSGATVERLVTGVSSVGSDTRWRRPVGQPPTEPSPADARVGAGGAQDPDSRAAWMTAGPSASLDGVEKISSLPSAQSSSSRAPRPPPLQEEDDVPSPTLALGEGVCAVVHGLDRDSRSSSLNGQQVTLLRRSSRQDDAWLVHMPNGGRKRLPEANLRPSPAVCGKGIPSVSSNASAPDSEQQQPGGAARAASPTADGRGRRPPRQHRAARHGHSGDPYDVLQSAEDILVRLEWRMKRRLDGLTGLS